MSKPERTKMSKYHVHPKTLIEIWLTCLDRVSANSKNCMVFQWAVKVRQGLYSRVGQSGDAPELVLVQIAEEA